VNLDDVTEGRIRMPDHGRNKRRVNPVWYGAVLLVGIIIAVFALSAARRSDIQEEGEDGTDASEPALSWRVDLPDDWRIAPGEDDSARFVVEGFTVGGIKKLPGLSGGEWDLTVFLPEGREILSSTQVAVEAGWGVVFDISVSVQPEGASSEQGLEPDESQPYMAAPTRPETHCLIPLEGATWDVWTRENVGFSPPAAREAAFFIIQGLRWAEEHETSLPGEVAMIAATSDEAYPDGRIWGKFDVEITVRNTSDNDARNLKVLVAKVISNPAYLELDTVVDTSLEQVAALDPGETSILRLAGLEAGHPEKDYEVIADVVGGGRPLKLRVRRAFPPGSED
jgi:hypothetical protein